MRKLLTIILLAIASTAFSQDTASGKGEGDVVFTFVQDMPAFSGDMEKFIKDNMKYPDAEKQANISGTVYVQFIVEKDGSLSGIAILKGIAKGPGLNKEALRIVSSMPKWKPGKQNGHAVRVNDYIAIHFVLK